MEILRDYIFVFAIIVVSAMVGGLIPICIDRCKVFSKKTLVWASIGAIVLPSFLKIGIFIGKNLF